ncbi:MAG TPA: hypothetical protein VFF69_14755 [Phycisphaerales bacterium]|nr:hypothetical protein [Phycisphaerales bacterium]
MFGLCAIVPALALLPDAARGITGQSAREAALGSIPARALASGAIYACSIALLAAMLAWPAALAVAGARRRWLVVLAAPLLLPPFLAFAAWSIARAPTTPLGRFIGGAPEHGLAWVPLAAARAFAVGGLALWAWPLAALVMAVGLRALGPEVRESLHLDGCRTFGRTRVLSRAVLPSIAAAIVLVALLMLGSAVPLHVARVETHAIRVWMVLDEHPAEPWLAWIAAWPLLVVAAAAGWLLSGPFARAAGLRGAVAGGEHRAPGVRPLALAAAALPWLLSIVVPFVLFLWSVGSARAISRFVRDASGGIASGAAIAAAVGVLATTLALGASHAVGSRRADARCIRPLLAMAIAWALIPGVLVGAAVAHVARMGWAPDWIAESAAPVVVAHVARVAFLPLLAGAWLGVSEPRALRELRELDGAGRPSAWAATAARSQLGPVLAVGVAAACLSFHEIEASIQVQPPGLDHLAQRLLQWLHYERTAELSAAGVVLLGAGLLATGAILLATRFARTPDHVHR